MSNYCLMVGWNRPVQGREAAAHEWYRSFVGQLATKMGTVITALEPIMLRPHGGDLNGFILLKGDKNKLDDLRELDQWKDLEASGSHCFQGFGVIEGFIGETFREAMTRSEKLAR